MSTSDLISEVESALAQLTERLPSSATADELPVELREALVTDEFSHGIAKVLAAQTEFASPMMVNSLSGATGFQPQYVAPMLLREARRRQSPSATVEWLQKVLSTERAEGIAVETFWGFSPTTSETLYDEMQLVPFASLPASRQKEALSEPRFDLGPRLATPVFAWEAPTAALVRPAVIEPYFRKADDNSQSNQGADYRSLFSDARLCLATCGPVAIVPGPRWFQYTDPDLELARLGPVTQLAHQEITPMMIEEHGTVDVAHAATLLCQLARLDADQKNRARTAMQRLGWACLRWGPAERALELAMALEALLVDSPGEHSFKIALRAALLTSTELESRRRHRAIIKEMYKIRSSLLHSGHAKATYKVGDYGTLQTTEIVSEALEITALVIRKIICLGGPPDWGSLELSIPAQTCGPNISQRRGLGE